MKLKVILLLFVYLINCGMLLGSDLEQNKKEIIRTVEKFFQVLEKRDINLAQSILMPNGITFSCRGSGQQQQVKYTSFRDLILSLPQSDAKLKEIINNPRVLVHRKIAVLWAEYKFYINGQFSHKGVDAFNLVKTKKGWKIAAIIYTVEK